MSGTAVLHRPVRVPSGSGRLTLTIPVHYEGYVRILLAVWLLAWGAMETVLLCSVIDQARGVPSHLPQSPVVLGVLLAFFTGAGIFMAWRLLWVSRGREILEVTPDRLRVHREPGGVATEEFSREGMRNLHIGSYSVEPIYPSWGRRFLGKEEAFISFEYEGKVREIARGIRRRDAEFILELLRTA